MKVNRRKFLKISLASAAATYTPSVFSKSAESTVMPMRRFGRHEDEVSVVGIGGHTLYQAGSQEKATAIVHRAIKGGINFFDNAWDYQRGVAEEYMGNALTGKRDEVFLMSKFCNYHIGSQNSDAATSMKMLEDSLRRLKTDYLDLWMLHAVSGDIGTTAYDPDGAIEAMELAKKQGKIRYTGFSGHSSPDVHRQLIEGGYAWDATLMPVSVVGVLQSRGFEALIPLCEKKGIAVLGMKGFGGAGRRNLHGRTSAEEVLRYSLSYKQVCTHLIGIDRIEYLNQAIAAAGSTPMSSNERAEYALHNN